MRSLLPILILINLSTSFIQAEDVKLDYTRWGLPEGVITRIGKGTRTAPVAISPETTRLAIATTIGIWLYDSETYQEIALLDAHKSPCSSLAFSPDGKTLAAGTQDGKIRLWNSQTGVSKETLTGKHTGWVNRLFFTPDGETLISVGSYWRGDGTIQFWDTKTWTHRAKLPHKIEDSAITLSPDGNVLASGHSKEIGLWDVKPDTANAASKRSTLKQAMHLISFIQRTSTTPLSKTVGKLCAYCSEQGLTFRTIPGNS